MKKTAILIALLTLCVGTGYAQSDTESEVRQHIVDNYAHNRENLEARPGDISREGSLDFFSSGGLLLRSPPDSPSIRYEVFTVVPKHIEVVTLVEGQAAVAHYYAEGSMQPKGAAAVPHYLTRVSEVYVKEDGAWKLRSSHYSALTGGSGTSQVATEVEP